MAGLIKNQILKHLSKFSKNLSADKINLSTLKGEGDLCDLELDEMVLTDLLDLPTWLRLTKATCNRLTIKIQWTKLSSQPICLYLDEIIVEMDTCDSPRTPTSVTQVSSYSTGGKYGFAEQIIDGMCVSINSVIVNFRAKDFSASIQLSRILVQSRTPCWQAGSLKMTRLKDELHGEVMIFKEAEWQTLRVEANAVDSRNPLLTSTPLRLIANQSKIRITIKKKIADCSIIASRLQINLDDLLWVLTDSQLKAALIFVGSLTDIVSRSREQSKRLAAEKLRRQAEVLSPSCAQASSQPSAAHLASQSQSSPSAGTKTGSQSQLKKAELFSRFDIKETSFHLYTGRIDLHLCDDASTDGECQKKVVGGAIQLVLQRMAFDSYPYHRAGADRSHWLRRDENMATRDAWAKQLLDEFRNDVVTARDAMASNNNSPSHSAVILSPSALKCMGAGSVTELSKMNTKPTASVPAQKPTSSRLLESCIVLRLEDFALYRVSSAMDSQRSSPCKFLASDKKLLMLPKNMSSIHVEFTEYYFPDGRDFPAPHSNLFAVVNPICMTVDYLTLEWLNAFLLDLAKNAVELHSEPSAPVHIDIRLDTLMPRVVLPPTDSLDVNIGRQYGGLEGLQIQLSKAIITNCAIGDPGKKSRTELSSVIKAIDVGRINCDGKAHSEYSSASGMAYITERLRRHASGTDQTCYETDRDAVKQKMFEGTSPLHNGLRAEMFQRPSSSDVWFVDVDQIWLEFVMAASNRGDQLMRRRTVPFVDAFPVVAWMSQVQTDTRDGKIAHDSGHANSLTTSSVPKLSKSAGQQPQSATQNVCAVMRAGTRDIKVQLDHQRYCFIMSLIDTLEQVKEEIDSDLDAAGVPPSALSATVTALAGNIWVDLVLAPLEDYPVIPISPDEEEDPEVDTTLLSTVNGIHFTPPVATVLQQEYNSELGLVTSDLADVGISVTDAGTDVQCLSDSTLPVTFSIAESDSQSSAVDIMSLYPEPSRVSSSIPDIQYSTTDSISHNNAELSLQSASTNDIRTSSIIPETLTRVASDNYDATKKFVAAVSGGQDFKKSINQVFGKFTDRMKVPRRQDTARLLGDNGELDGWDTLSTRSGLSDDDDDAASLLYHLDAHFEQPAFEHQPVPSDDASVATSDMRDDEMDIGVEVKSLYPPLVSVISVNLQTVQAVVRLVRSDIAVDATVESMTLKELGNMSGDKFQEYFISGNHGTPGASVSDTHHRPQPVVRAHIDVQPPKQIGVPSNKPQMFMAAAVEGFTTQIRMTSLAHISELFLDSKPAEVFPLIIDVSDISVTLLDDQKSPYNAVPTMTPIELRIRHAVAQRDDQGVFHIGAGGTAPSPSTTMLSLPFDLLSGSVRMDLSEHLAADQARRRSDAASSISSFQGDSASHISDLEHENDVLRRQLEKIGKMDGFAIERSRPSAKPVETKSRDRSWGRREEADKLRTENRDLVQRLREQAEEIMDLKQERESLLLTIQLLQDDLSASERQRSRQAPTPT